MPALLADPFPSSLPSRPASHHPRDSPDRATLLRSAFRRTRNHSSLSSLSSPRSRAVPRVGAQPFAPHASPPPQSSHGTLHTHQRQADSAATAQSEGSPPAKLACSQAKGEPGAERLSAFLVRGRLRPLQRVDVEVLTRDSQSVWCKPTRLNPLKLECQTAEGTLRFTTAEDMERYIGMLPNVRSQNFRCFCTEWIFGANLVECVQCHHRLHVKCSRKWLHRRRCCPYCQTPQDRDGSILQPVPNGCVDIEVCSSA